MGIGKWLDDAGEAIGELADDAGLDNVGHVIDSGFEQVGEGLSDAWQNALHPALVFVNEYGWNQGVDPALQAIANAPQHTGFLLNVPAVWGDYQEFRTDDRNAGFAEDITSGTVGAAGRSLNRAGIDADTVLSPANIPILGGWLGATGAADPSQSESFQTLTDPDFDITDPALRAQAFEQGFGKYARFTVDMTARWYLDPLVIGGKTIAATRRATVTKPITDRTDLDAAAGLLPGKAGRVRKMTDDLAAMSPNARATYLANHRAFSGNVALQQLLTEAPGAPAMRAILRSAMENSAEARSRLAQLSAADQLRIDRIADLRIPSLQSALSVTAGGGETAMRLDRTALNRQLRMAEEELKATKEAQRVHDLMYDAAGTVRQVPRVTAGEKLADKVQWHVLQPSRYNAPVRVLKSAGQARVSIIDHNRPGSAVRAANSLLNRVGHGWDKRPGLLTGGGSRVTMPQGQKNALLLAVQRAESSRDVAAVEKAIRDVEAAAITFYAGQMGLAPEKAKDILALANSKRDQARSTVFGGNGSTAYSGVTRPDGTRLDEIEDGVGSIVRTPVTTSQFSDTMPVLDVDQVARFLRRHKDDLDDDATMDVVMGRKVVSAWDSAGAMGTEILAGFNRIWKPAQLFRLGWPLRVITDENFRIMSTLGAMTHLPLVARSLEHSALDSRLANRYRDIRPGERQMRAAAAERAEIMEAYKAAGAQRATSVDRLHAVDTELGALDGQITAAGTRLRAAYEAQLGERLFLDVPAGTRVKMGTRGVAYRHGQEPPSTAGVTRTRAVGPHLSDDAVYVPSGAVDEAPTVAFLRSELHPRDFDALYAMTNAALREKIRLIAPSTTRVPTSAGKADLIETYGAVLARHKGYKAIYQAVGENPTFLALTDDVVRPLDRSVFTRAAEDYRTLLARREQLGVERRGLATDEAALPAWTQEYEEDLARVLAAAKKPSQARRERGKGTRFSATAEDRTVFIRHRDGRKEYINDAFGGRYGGTFADLSSGASVTRYLAGTQDRYLNGMRLEHGQSKVLPPVMADATNAAPAKVKAYQTSYDSAWERAVNDQLGQNELAVRVMRGDSTEDIVAWLKHSKPGRDMRRTHPIRSADPHRWVEEVRMQVDSYLPTAELRALALRGEAKADDLKAAFPDAADRPTVHGENLALTTGEHEVVKQANRLVDGIYHKLGTLPTDALSRHPFFTAHYRREMQRQLDSMQLPDGAVLGTDDIARMERASREHALRKTRETLYDVSNETHLGHTMRFVAPFYNAWSDALTTWGKIWLEDPSRLARMTQIWQAPENLDLVYETADGRKMVVMPEGMRKILPLPDEVENAGIPQYWMRDLIAQGKYWMLPGTGPAVAVPVAELVRNKPDLYDLVRPLLPFGTGENMLDDVLPAGYKRLVSKKMAEDDPAYVSALLRISAELETDKRLGKNNLTPAQLQAEAARRTDAFFGVRAFASFVLPYAPDFRSPYQTYINAWRKLQEEYAEFPDGRDPASGKTAQTVFLDTYGEDFFHFTRSATESNIGGISPTVEGYDATRKYADLIAEAPEFGKLIVGSEDQGEFSNEVFQYQRQNNIAPGDLRKQREFRNPQEAARDAEAQRGWDEYRKIATALDQALASRGLRSITATGAADLLAAKRALVANLSEKYAGWAEDYQSFDKGKSNKLIGFLETHIDDDRFATRPGFDVLREYLSARRTFMGALQQRKAAGGSGNLDAVANADLAAGWSELVGSFRLRNTYFADFAARWLDSDKLEAA